MKKMTAEEKRIYMTETPMPKLILKLAIPTIISMLITTFYNLVDTYFVGNINTQASGAIAIVFVLMSIIQAFGFMFGHGSGSLVSMLLGSGKTQEASKVANAGFFFAIVFGTICIFPMMIFRDGFARFLQATETILPYARAYMTPIILAMPIMMGSVVLNNQIRYQGNAKTAMFGICAGAIINIGLDPLFIYVFKMGVAGAGWATAASQVCSFTFLLFITHWEGNIRITVKENPFAFRYLPKILYTGVPSLIRQGFGCVAGLLLNYEIKKAVSIDIADSAIAGMGIVNRVVMFANSALIGFGQGFQPACGFNYGMGNYKRVRQGFFFCVRVAVCFLICTSVIGVIFAPTIVNIFIANDPTAVEIGAFAMRAQCIPFVCAAWTVLTNMLLQATGQGLRASIVAACRQGIVFIPLLIILSENFGLVGVQIAQPISDVISVLVALVVGLLYLKTLKQKDKSNV